MVRVGYCTTTHLAHLDPVIYPNFNIYPVIDSRVEVFSKTVPKIRHEPVEVRLPSLYPDFDICEFKYRELWIALRV